MALPTVRFPKEKPTGHMVMVDDGVKCLHCGEVQKIVYPIRVSMFVAMEKAFSKIHINCKPKANV